MLTNNMFSTKFASCLSFFVFTVFCYMSPAYAAEPSLAPILRIDPGEHTATIKRIAADDLRRYLVTASDDKTARVWSLADGRLLNILRVPIGNGNEGKLYAVAISPSGQTIAVGGYTQFSNGSATPASDGHTIYLFDRTSGQLLRRITGLPAQVRHITFSTNSQTLAVTMSEHGLRLYSIVSGQLLAEDRDYQSGSYSVHFNPVTANDDQQLITTSLDGFLRLYRLSGNKLSLLAKRAAPDGKQPHAARFSPNGKLIAVGFIDTPAVNVLNSSDLRLDNAPDTTGVNANLFSIEWSPQGDYLYAGGQADKQFEGRTESYIRRWKTYGKELPQDWSIATSQTITGLIALHGGQIIYSSTQPSWGMLNAQGQIKLLHAPVIADFRGNREKFGLSTDGAQVSFAYEAYGKSTTIFDSQLRTFATEKILNAPVISSPGLEVTDWQNSATPKFNGMLLKLEANEVSRSLAMLPQGAGFALGTEGWLRLYDRSGKQRWQQVAPGAVWAVNASLDGRWIVAAYGDGTLRWHRTSDGAEQLAFFPHSDKRRWVMWTPSGYYDASPGAENLIGWHVNNGKNHAADFFPASRFRDRFNRTDVLSQILNTQDETEALKLANNVSGRSTQTVSIATVLPPVVSIITPATDTAVKTTRVKIQYGVRTLADAPVTGFRVRVNGLPQSAARALKLSEAAANDLREIEVNIPEQDSEITLFAVNKNGVSSPATLRLTWDGTKSAPSAAEALFKPKLYILAVGVSKYRNPDFNLGLAAKDAKDFAAVFQKQKGKLYGDVVVKLITDEKATRDEVVDGLDWLKQQVTARDVGIMFLAGHGMNDNTGSYYFLPHNADPDKLLRTGVAQNDIKVTLNTLAGKAMFFVDSCHSGNALGSSKTRAISGSTDAIVNELASAENGVIVFSSSTGKQLSQENPAWGNGAFTKAVVEGLNGKADFTRNGKITHKGLDYYVTERVKELTKGQQSPVSISPSGVTDFPIAVVGK